MQFFPGTHTLDAMTQNPQKSLVLVALGSNIGDRETYLHEATKRIAQLCGPIVAAAPTFATEPEGGVANQVFLNSALICETTLTPEEFLKRLHEIEAACGRERARRWDNRTLDLDIILWQRAGCSIQMTGDNLTVPHPRFQSRLFVLAPAVAIAADWLDPVTGKTVRQLHDSLK